MNKYIMIILYMGFFLPLLSVANYVKYWSILSESMLNLQPLYFIIIVPLVMAPVFSIIGLKYKRITHVAIYCDEVLGLLLIIMLISIFIFYLYQVSFIALITEPLYLISVLLVFTPIRLLLEHIKALIMEDNPLKIGLLAINFYILIVIIFTSQEINIKLTGNYLQDLGFKFSMLTLYMFKYILPWITIPVSLDQSITYLKMTISAYEMPPILGLFFMSAMIITLFKIKQEIVISNAINILLYSSLGLLTYLFIFNDPLLSTFQSISPWFLLLLMIIILSMLGVLK